MSSLLRRLNAADITLITIGAVIGSGIFRNPAVVAQRAHFPSLIIGAWIAGGILALISAFIFAELSERRPVSGGLYAYLRDAYHPVVAFVFGWMALLISDTGGTAASAVLFAGYFTAYIAPLTGHTFAPAAVAVATLAVVAAVNCFGVRQGSTWQHVWVVLKVAAIAGIIAAGLFAHPNAAPQSASVLFTSPATMVTAFGFAMLPVLFAYNGFQGATYLTAETIEPQRTMPRGLILGVVAVVAIYVLVNIGCLRVLGPAGLAASATPAADVVQAALGPAGGRLTAIAVALSTLGFMSTRMLLAPRIYFQMAADGTFFKWIAWIDPRTRAPIVAILLQGAIAAVIAAYLPFEKIVNWVTVPEWFFIALAAGAIFIFRKRDAGAPQPKVRVPGHPWTTLALLASLAGILVAELVTAPRDALYGAIVLLSGVIFFYLWHLWLSLRREGWLTRGR